MTRPAGKFSAVTKDGHNPHFNSKFTSLANTVKTAAPTLAEHGLAVVQLPGVLDGQDSLTTVLMHKSGELLGCEVAFLDNLGSDTAAAL